MNRDLNCDTILAVTEKSVAYIRNVTRRLRRPFVYLVMVARYH